MPRYTTTDLISPRSLTCNVAGYDAEGQVSLADMLGLAVTQTASGGLYIPDAAPNPDEYHGDTSPGSEWGRACGEILHDVRTRLPAGWTAVWCDDGIALGYPLADEWAERLGDMLTGLRLTPTDVTGDRGYVWVGEIPAEEDQEAELERYAHVLCDPQAHDVLAGLREPPDEHGEEVLAARVRWLWEQGWLAGCLGDHGQELVDAANVLLLGALERKVPPITTLAAALRLARGLPAGVVADECGWSASAAHGNVLVLPGYVADWEGTAEIVYADAPSARDAAQAYYDSGTWDPCMQTEWLHIDVWRRAITGDGSLIRVGETSVTITREPVEPDCADGEDHDWRAPYSVLGGDPRNPGVWGNVGGVIYRVVCRHCGIYRETNTWATDPSTGKRGLTSVSYEDADDDSRAYVARADA